ARIGAEVRGQEHRQSDWRRPVDGADAGDAGDGRRGRRHRGRRAAGGTGGAGHPGHRGTPRHQGMRDIHRGAGGPRRVNRGRMSNEIFILGGARTPMGEYTGKLKDHSAIDLGAIAARAAIERTGVPPDAIDHVVFGNVLQTSSDAVYGARHVGLRAGLPIEVPALTVNRLCGSGIQAAVSGAHLILTGEADIVLTGGMESMSQAPHVIRGLRTGLRLGQGQLEDTLWSALLDTQCGFTMAGTAENCAKKYGITREAQDEYALRSQKLADAAWKSGRLKEEVVPV